MRLNALLRVTLAVDLSSPGRQRQVPTRRLQCRMPKASMVMSTLALMLLVAASLGDARKLQDATCTVTLGGGLDPIAGKTDVTLSHNCNNGYAQTQVVAGELVDFYR